MQHEEFARQAAKHLGAMAASLKEDHTGGIGGDTTSIRANELQVAAHVVLALSKAATRAEDRRSILRSGVEAASTTSRRENLTAPPEWCLRAWGAPRAFSKTTP